MKHDAVYDSLRSIARDVDVRVAGASVAAADEWAVLHARRNRLAFDLIVEAARRKAATGDPVVHVLNAGGLGKGHQDFSISLTLRELAPEVQFTWTTLDHPSSPYLTVEPVRQYLRESGIVVHHSDLDKREPAFGLSDARKFDIILFTEIVEHLEHSTTVIAFHNIRALLAENGRLLVTTPNISRLSNRLRLLLGRGDLGYWGDGIENVQTGMLGHVVYFDVDRLRRLLRDAGLTTVSATTRNLTTVFGTSGRERLIRLMYEILERLIPRAGQNVVIVAALGQQQRVEYRIW